MALLVSNKLNINAIIKVLFILYDQSLKYFFKKNLEIFKLLLILFKASSRKFFNLN